MKKANILIRIFLLIILIGSGVAYFYIAYPKQQALKHFNLAVAAYNQKDYQTAIQEYKKAIEYNPQFPEVYYNLTIAYVETSQFDAVIETGIKAVQLNPADTELYFHIATAYEQKGLDELAVAEYQKYIQSAPKGEFVADANQKITMLEEKLHPPQTVEEKLQKANRDLDMINNALRAQHAAITAARATSQNAP